LRRRDLEEQNIEGGRRKRVFVDHRHGSNTGASARGKKAKTRCSPRRLKERERKKREKGGRRKGFAGFILKKSERPGTLFEKGEKGKIARLGLSRPIEKIVGKKGEERKEIGAFSSAVPILIVTGGGRGIRRR